MAKNPNDYWSGVSKSIDQMFDSAVQSNVNTFDKGAKKIEEGAKRIGSSIEKLNPKVNKKMDFMGEFAKQANDLARAFPALAEGLGVVTGAVDGLMIAVKAAITAMTSWVGIISALAVAVGAVLGAVLKRTIDISKQTETILKSFGGDSGRLKEFTDLFYDLTLSTRLNSEQLSELGESFQNFGMPVDNSTTHLKEFLDVAGQGVHIMNASNETMADFIHTMRVLGTSSGGTYEVLSNVYKTMIKDNISMSQTNDILTEAHHLWAEYGYISGQGLEQTTKNILDLKESFRSVNIEGNVTKDLLGNVFSDQHKFFKQAAFIASTLHMSGQAAALALAGPGGLDLLKQAMAIQYARIARPGQGSQFSQLARGFGAGNVLAPYGGAAFAPMFSTMSDLIKSGKLTPEGIPGWLASQQSSGKYGGTAPGLAQGTTGVNVSPYEMTQLPGLIMEALGDAGQSKIIKPLNSIDSNIARIAGSFLTNPVGTTNEALKNAWKGVKSGAGAANTAVKDMWKGAKGAGKVFGGIATGAISHWDTISKAAQTLGMNPIDLWTLISFESGGNPARRNMAGSGATGLIQFMPSTAKGLGTTTAALSEMTFDQQMDYVVKYLKNKGSLNSVEDAYMSVLSPAFKGKDPNTIMWKEGSVAYRQNRGFDTHHHGYIQVKDVYERIEKHQQEIITQLQKLNSTTAEHKDVAKKTAQTIDRSSRKNMSGSSAHAAIAGNTV